MTQPITRLHYATGASLATDGTYPAGTIGFNLADISSVAELDALPAGVTGLAWLGMGNGVDAAFQLAVNQYIGDPKLYGFYLMDEPDPSVVSAANLKAEADYIHAHIPGAKTFITLLNTGTDANPVFGFNVANTDIDLFGLDPYPVQVQYGGANYSIIGASVSAAQAQGIPLSDIVPVYQAFGGGGYASWILPTAPQEQTILSTWGSLVPTPAFDYTYSWAVQNGDTALSTAPSDLQQVFAVHNAVMPAPPSSGVPHYDHVVVVVMENHDYGEIIGNTAQAPYINSLVTSGALLTNYSDSGSHPSEPNYFALYAGSTFGVTDDNFHSETSPSLATILQAAGKTFTGFVEGGGSDQNHNPWEYFPEGTSVEKDFATYWPTGNFSSLPDVSFVIPNVNNDMHNGTIAQGDAWLRANIDAYAQWAKANNSLLDIVWDEGSSGDHVANILVGANVVPGTYSTAYDHYSTLSTILAANGLSGPNDAATAPPINVFATSVNCFLAGTCIATPDGSVPVEELAIGDRVLAKFAGTAPVQWIGRRQIDCRRHPDPERVWPVCVRRGAFGDNMPFRDLWLSPDHAVFVDDVLIPVRQLINGMNIFQEQMERVTYFHVELARHDVLTAEGLQAESYLDTGNRAMFANGGAEMALHPDFATVNAGLECRERDACAPLVVCAEEVEPVWRRLAARAEALGYATSEPSLTTDPRIRLEACGREFAPLSNENGWHTFVLPPGTDTVRLVSRAESPANIRPWLEDRRRLGVCVSRIRLRSSTDLMEIPVDHPSFETGWWGTEGEGNHLWRWTDGHAELPLPVMDTAKSPIVLEIAAAGFDAYRLPSERGAQDIPALCGRGAHAG